MISKEKPRAPRDDGPSSGPWRRGGGRGGNAFLGRAPPNNWGPDSASLGGATPGESDGPMNPWRGNYRRGPPGRGTPGNALPGNAPLGAAPRNGPAGSASLGGAPRNGRPGSVPINGAIYKEAPGQGSLGGASFGNANPTEADGHRDSCEPRHSDYSKNPWPANSRFSDSTGLPQRGPNDGPTCNASSGNVSTGSASSGNAVSDNAVPGSASLGAARNKPPMQSNTSRNSNPLGAKAGGREGTSGDGPAGNAPPGSASLGGAASNAPSGNGRWRGNAPRSRGPPRNAPHDSATAGNPPPVHLPNPQNPPGTGKKGRKKAKRKGPPIPEAERKAIERQRNIERREARDKADALAKEVERSRRADAKARIKFYQYSKQTPWRAGEILTKVKLGIPGDPDPTPPPVLDEKAAKEKEELDQIVFDMVQRVLPRIYDIRDRCGVKAHANDEPDTTTPYRDEFGQHPHYKRIIMHHYLVTTADRLRDEAIRDLWEAVFQHKDCWTPMWFSNYIQNLTRLHLKDIEAHETQLEEMEAEKFERFVVWARYVLKQERQLKLLLVDPNRGKWINPPHKTKKGIAFKPWWDEDQGNKWIAKCFREDPEDLIEWYLQHLRYVVRQPTSEFNYMKPIILRHYLITIADKRRGKNKGSFGRSRHQWYTQYILHLAGGLSMDLITGFEDLVKDMDTERFKRLLAFCKTYLMEEIEIKRARAEWEDLDEEEMHPVMSCYRDWYVMAYLLDLTMVVRKNSKKITFPRDRDRVAMIPRRSKDDLDACARCHPLRAPITDDEDIFNGPQDPSSWCHSCRSVFLSNFSSRQCHKIDTKIPENIPNLSRTYTSYGQDIDIKPGLDERIVYLGLRYPQRERWVGFRTFKRCSMHSLHPLSCTRRFRRKDDITIRHVPGCEHYIWPSTCRQRKDRTFLHLPGCKHTKPPTECHKRKDGTMKHLVGCNHLRWPTRCYVKDDGTFVHMEGCKHRKLKIYRTMWHHSDCAEFEAPEDSNGKGKASAWAYILDRPSKPCKRRKDGTALHHPDCKHLTPPLQCEQWRNGTLRHHLGCREFEAPEWVKGKDKASTSPCIWEPPPCEITGIGYENHYPGCEKFEALKGSQGRDKVSTLPCRLDPQSIGCPSRDDGTVVHLQGCEGRRRPIICKRKNNGMWHHPACEKFGVPEFFRRTREAGVLPCGLDSGPLELHKKCRVVASSALLYNPPSASARQKGKAAYPAETLNIKPSSPKRLKKKVKVSVSASAYRHPPLSSASLDGDFGRDAPCSASLDDTSDSGWSGSSKQPRSSNQKGKATHSAERLDREPSPPGKFEWKGKAAALAFRNPLPGSASLGGTPGNPIPGSASVGGDTSDYGRPGSSMLRGSSSQKVKAVSFAATLVTTPSGSSWGYMAAASDLLLSTALAGKRLKPPRGSFYLGTDTWESGPSGRSWEVRRAGKAAGSIPDSGPRESSSSKAKVNASASAETMGREPPESSWHPRRSRRKGMTWSWAETFFMDSGPLESSTQPGSSRQNGNGKVAAFADTFGGGLSESHKQPGSPKKGKRYIKPESWKQKGKPAASSGTLVRGPPKNFKWKRNGAAVEDAVDSGK